MKRIVAILFMVLLFVFSLLVHNINSCVLDDICYDVKGVMKCSDLRESGIDVGGYNIVDLNKLPLHNVSYDYISFKVSHSNLHIVFDLFNIHIVNKYIVFDNIVYDCILNNVLDNVVSNAQIVVGDEIIIGIPTIFEGF